MRQFEIWDHGYSLVGMSWLLSQLRGVVIEEIRHFFGWVIPHAKYRAGNQDLMLILGVSIFISIISIHVVDLTYSYHNL